MARQTATNIKERGAPQCGSATWRSPPDLLGAHCHRPALLPDLLPASERWGAAEGGWSAQAGGLLQHGGTRWLMQLQVAKCCLTVLRARLPGN